MKKFLKNNGIKLLVATVLISVGVVLLNFVSGPLSVPSVLNFFMTPLKMVSNRIANATAESIKKRQTEEDYKQEIVKLKNELRTLRAVAVDYYNVKRENAQYLKFYDFKKRNKDLKFVSGAVISKDPNEPFGGFTLGIGSDAGVSKNAPVITENGLVGRVSEVSGNSCNVKTIFSPKLKAGAINPRTGDTGVVCGDIKTADQNLTKMMNLPSQHTMQPDDIIVTSGLGGIYPKDIPVGKVKEIRHDEFDSSFFAVIEPFDKIDEIVDVFVITDFEGKSEAVSLEKEPSRS